MDPNTPTTPPLSNIPVRRSDATPVPPVSPCPGQGTASTGTSPVRPSRRLYSAPRRPLDQRPLPPSRRMAVLPNFMLSVGTSANAGSVNGSRVPSRKMGLSRYVPYPPSLWPHSRSSIEFIPLVPRYQDRVLQASSSAITSADESTAVTVPSRENATLPRDDKQSILNAEELCSSIVTDLNEIKEMAKAIGLPVTVKSQVTESGTKGHSTLEKFCDASYMQNPVMCRLPSNKKPENSRGLSAGEANVQAAPHNLQVLRDPPVNNPSTMFDPTALNNPLGSVTVDGVSLSAEHAFPSTRAWTTSPDTSDLRGMNSGAYGELSGHTMPLHGAGQIPAYHHFDWDELDEFRTLEDFEDPFVNPALGPWWSINALESVSNGVSSVEHTSPSPSLPSTPAPELSNYENASPRNQ